MSEPLLRDQLNGAKSIEEATAVLDEESLLFTADEFDEAYNNLLTLCQFEEQADQLEELKKWWELLLQFLAGDQSNANVACTSGIACSSRGTCSGCH